MFLANQSTETVAGILNVIIVYWKLFTDKEKSLAVTDAAKFNSFNMVK